MLFFCNLSNRIAVADEKGSVLFVHQLNRVVCQLKLQNHRSTNRNITTLRISFTRKNIIPPGGSHSARSLAGNIRTDYIAALYQILKLRLEGSERRIPCYIERAFPKSCFFRDWKFIADFNFIAAINIAVAICKSYAVSAESEVAWHGVFNTLCPYLCRVTSPAFPEQPDGRLQHQWESGRHQAAKRQAHPFWTFVSPSSW